MANNFVSNDNATDLMNAINLKKDTKPGTITWDEWIALTDEQREGTHYIITDVPASFSSKDAVFALRNVTLEFTNKTAVITDARVTSAAYLFTFYYNEAVAQAAGIDCTWGNGTITFTVEENPTSDITLDILAILPALATPTEGTDGHTIQNSTGTDMTQRSNLQFVGATVTDDSTNDRTVVTINGGGGDIDASDVTYNETTVEDALDSLSTDVSGKVNKSGDTMSGNLYVNRSDGTTSELGTSQINLGNSVAQGTDKNSYGRLAIFGKGTNYTFLQATKSTENRTIELPDKAGTVALTSDLDTKVSKSGDTMTDSLTIAYPGTTEAEGFSELRLGNNIPAGTDGNAHGIILLYGSTGKRVSIDAFRPSADRSVTLPDKNGTLATTSDIPTISFNGSLGSGQDVLTVAKNMPNNSIAYYKNSNKPTNRPTNGDYGAYEFIKSDNMTMIKYISGSMTACAYGIESSATSITWHIS